MTTEDLTSVTRELEAIEQRLASTWKDGDCEGWAALIAPEWSVTHITGEVITRDQALQMCRHPQTVIADMVIDRVPLTERRP